MLLTKTVNVNWSNTNKKWYIEKGYNYTKNGEGFEVRVEDLTKCNNARIVCLCDYCLEEGIETKIESSWSSYNRHKTNKDNCSKHIGVKQKEMGVLNRPTKTRYTKEQIKEKYIELYYELNEVVPSNKEVTKKYKVDSTYPSMREIQNAFGTLTQLKKYCNFNASTQTHKYSEKQLLEKLQNHVEKYGLENINTSSFKKDKEIPIYKVYVNAFGNDLVHMLELAGYNLSQNEKDKINKYKTTLNITKEEVVKIILQMQSKLDRPLMLKDFERNEEVISRNTINKFWGTMNKMKEELKLEIVQEDMGRKHIDNFDDIQQDIISCCDKVFELEKRRMIMYQDIIKYSRYDLNITTIRKYCKENSTTIRKIIESNGYELQREGRGLLFYYNDGEKVRSSYELLFSNKLREYGYVYNKDYFRDVRYKEFINDYNGLLDCDYVIHINDKIIHIEIAGLINGYDEKYMNHEFIPSKSKREYIQKLKIKEDMLSKNNLNYFIILSIDLKDLDNLFKNVIKLYPKNIAV